MHHENDAEYDRSLSTNIIGNVLYSGTNNYDLMGHTLKIVYYSTYNAHKTFLINVLTPFQSTNIRLL